MNVKLTEEQNKLIEKIAVSNGFSDYELITKPGSEKGDNFLGILITVTIKDGNKRLELILKSAHQSEAFRKAALLEEVYRREIFVYQKIFEEFKKFQEEYNIPNPFNSYVKMYDASTLDGHESLVMENLKVEGFKLWNKKVPMNAEHITIILREYGKFHATSVALKHKNPEIFKNLTKDIILQPFQNENEEENTVKFESFVKAVCSAAYKVIEDEPALTRYLKNVESEMLHHLSTDFKDPEYKQVIVHGDCWCNNFLFKYDDNNNAEQPSLLRIIDWQLTYLGSPASDFCYFFLAHSPKEILDDYKTYLNIYYDAFSKHLRHFNCDPDELFSYSTMEKHVDKFMVFGVYMCLLIFKIMLADSDEAPDFQKFSEDGDLMEGMNFQVSNIDGFKSRVKDILIFLKEHRFITE